MDPAQLQPGFRLDRYELLCPLAYGGMASVWLARFGGRRGFERLVVVKMILPQYSQDPRFQEMFADEARIASRIEHGNVARILDVGEEAESTFLVMEWVDGDSLSKIVRAAEQRGQPIPPGIALRIIADAASGLHAAHVLCERDGTPLHVVHRDVSPQNILVSNAGTTVLIDFGVAKARDRVSQETSVGQLKGKIRYMAPEQALGREVDHRADIWALGAVLYELFAGVPPFDGKNEVATLHKLTSGVAPNPLPPTVPDAVRAVVARALAYDPDARHASAADLSVALEAALLAVGQPTSAAAVAQYTGQLLEERKSARKRAVDAALASAHARDAERASSVAMAAAYPTSSGALPLPAPSGPELPSSAGSASPAGGAQGSMGSQGSLATRGQAGYAQGASGAQGAHRAEATRGTPNAYAAEGANSPQGSYATQGANSPQGSYATQGASGAQGSYAARGATAGQGLHASSGPLGFGESPSTTSSTLGSAAMEYPPEVVEDSRRRRAVNATVLGVSLVAGLVGVALIISSTAIRRERASGARSAAASAQGAPAEAANPPPTGAATSRLATGDPAPVSMVVTTSAPSAPPTSASSAPIGTAPAASSSAATHRASPPPPSPAAAPSPPPAAAPTARKPPPAPAPQGKPDRGF
jgi:serine/threonine-protein kinase